MPQAISTRLTRMPQAILIYDSKCSYCRAFKTAISRLDKGKKIAFWPYYSGKAKELLKAQFGQDYGFTLYLFQKDKVSLGAEAVKACFMITGKPSLQAYRLYPIIVRFVSIATGRKRKTEMPHGHGRKARTAAKARGIMTKYINAAREK